MSAPADVLITSLTDAETADLDALAQAHPDLVKGTPEDPDWQRACASVAHELPAALRSALIAFRTEEPAPLLIIRGIRVDDEAIGPTPASWRESRLSAGTGREVFLFYLVASILGEPIGWATKQDGRIIHDIVPVRGDEDEQLGSSSRTELTWHTEDGFHPLRADYLGLMCLRNPYRARTTIGTLDPAQLPGDVASVLWQERFLILPDGSHFQEISPAVREQVGPEVLGRGRRRLEALRDAPPPRAVLSGSPDGPYLCLDQYFAQARDGDAQAASALRQAIDTVTRGITGHELQPGDICFIDNYRAVHGREAFTARFDGTDRWLKRVNLTRDLRRSREFRAGPASRVIA